LDNSLERLRISRDLHDGLAQEIAAIGYQLDALIGRNDLAPALRPHLRSIRTQVSELSMSARDEIYQLRKASPVSDLQQLTRELTEIASTYSKSYQLVGALPTLHTEVFLAVLAELFRNFCRHESDELCTITLTENEITLAPVQTKSLSFSSERLGLRGAQERLAKISWEFLLTGSTVSIIPIRSSQF